MNNVILSDERIAEIRDRVGALPTREWAVRRISLTDDVAHIVDDAGRIVAIVQVVANQLRVPATFIASARQDVPDLLAEREALVAAFNDIGSAVGTVKLDAVALVMTPPELIIAGVHFLREEVERIRRDWLDAEARTLAYRDHARIATENAQAIEAERLALVDELRQEREKREAFEKALSEIAVGEKHWRREDMIDHAAEALIEQLPPENRLTPEPAPVVAQGE